MKVLLIHGNDIENARRRLQKFADTARSRTWESVRMEAGTERVADVLQTQNLFNTPRFIIVESAQKMTKQDRDFLANESSHYSDTVVLFATTLVTKAFLDSVGKIDTIESFQIEVTLWKFLESFKKGNAKNALKLFHTTLASEAPEYILAMLSRLVRDMYQVKIEPKSMNLPDWRFQKLNTQASKFDEAELSKVIAELAEIDIGSKTSNVDLAGMLDCCIAITLE